MGGVPKKQKPCAYCGELFTPRSKNSYFCSVDCRDAERERLKRERERKRQNASFLPVFAYINRYYQETGIYLSYGKAVARMHLEQQQQKKEQGGKTNERVHTKQKK